MIYFAQLPESRHFVAGMTENGNSEYSHSNKKLLE